MEETFEKNLLRLGLIDEQGMTPMGKQVFLFLGEKLPRLEKNPQVTELSPEEVQIAVRLLSRAGTHRTGTDLFEAIWGVVPMAPSEHAVVRKIDGEWHALMWRRPPNDRNFLPFLHLPGGYPLVGETDAEWIGRVLKKEAGLTLVRHYFVRRINMCPETGWVPNHQLANMFLCEVEGEPTNGKWIPLTAVPPDTLGHHVYYAQLIRAHLLRMKTMRERGIQHDYLAFAPEHKFAVVYLIPWGDEWRADSADCIKPCGTLDEAIAIYNGPSPDARIVVDDQGYQIL